jgi:hypothetical protein
MAEGACHGVGVGTATTGGLVGTGIEVFPAGSLAALAVFAAPTIGLV